MPEPARVAAAISEISDEPETWQHAAGMAVDEASHIQTHAAERVTRAERLAALASHYARERLDDLTHTRESADHAMRAGSEASGGVAHRAASVANARDFAATTLSAWHAELNAAIAWLERARQRVRAAEAWVARAQAQVSSAKSALSRAESNLRRCRNDPDRRNCNSEAQSYNNAQHALAVAIADLRAAEEELRQAREEEARAERRVACCRQAVERAEQALAIVERAEYEVAEASHMSTLAGDHARDAVNRCASASDATRRQREAAEAAERDADRADELLMTASTQLRQAEASYEGARRLSFDAGAEMRQGSGSCATSIAPGL